MLYTEVIEKFERRFGFKELPATLMIAFNSARQLPDESIDDWSDRVLTLASKAFRDLPDQYMTQQSILRFCHGGLDREAGENVSNMRPTTMDDAIDKLKMGYSYTQPYVWKEKRGAPSSNRGWRYSHCVNSYKEIFGTASGEY